MKDIKIAERLKPFSHLPGATTLLPGTGYQVQVFPVKLRIFDLSKTTPHLLTEVDFDLKGPFERFTVQNDLEKREIRVWGDTPAGFFRYKLKNATIHFEKIPGGSMHLAHEGIQKTIQTKEQFNLLPEMPSVNLHPLERLSLGNHKAQDWDLVQRRLDLTEILPVWYRLGQMLPKLTCQGETGGTLTLLETCREALKQNQPEKIMPLWKQLYQAGVSGILVPRLIDDQFQGLVDSPILPQDISPLALFTEFTQIMRACFIQSEKNCVKILPSLPPEFHCGRMTNILLENAKLSIEWSKKVIRRMEVLTDFDKEIFFNFKHVKQCRLRTSKNEKGKIVLSGSSVYLTKNKHYLFDNFK